MRRENGIFDIKVISDDGFFSDHYNPLNKTVNLNREINDGTNISVAAVATHECGHAVQHASAYGPLMLKSKLVPAVHVSSMLVNWILLAGIIVFGYHEKHSSSFDRDYCDEYNCFIYPYYSPG